MHEKIIQVQALDLGKWVQMLKVLSSSFKLEIIFLSLDWLLGNPNLFLIVKVYSPFDNGICFHILDLLCTVTRVWNHCTNETAFSCIRETQTRPVHGMTLWTHWVPFYLIQLNRWHPVHGVFESFTPISMVFINHRESGVKL